MSTPGLRVAALALAAVHPRDRAWLLARLDGHTARQLRVMLDRMPAQASQLGLDDVRKLAPVAAPGTATDTQAAPPSFVRGGPQWLQGAFDSRPDAEIVLTPALASLIRDRARQCEPASVA